MPGLPFPGLSAELLLQAYAYGIFPMAEAATDPEIFWVDPEERGVIPLDGFHVPKRLARTLRSKNFVIRCDTVFERVIRECAAPAPDRPQTWINDDIIAVYTELFERGAAHSVESWAETASGEWELVGGLYGVHLGAAFFGESMFSRATDASKVALVHLVARLVQGGFRLLDTQFVTTHLGRFGAVEIPRAEYRRKLAVAIRHQAYFPLDLPPEFTGDPVSFLQSRTPTS